MWVIIYFFQGQEFKAWIYMFLKLRNPPHQIISSNWELMIILIIFFNIFFFNF